MIVFNYPSKKVLKESIGKRLRYIETSMLTQSAGPRRGWYVRMVGGSGMLYRASAKQLSKAIIVEA